MLIRWHHTPNCGLKQEGSPLFRATMPCLGQSRFWFALRRTPRELGVFFVGHTTKTGFPSGFPFKMGYPQKRRQRHRNRGTLCTSAGSRYPSVTGTRWVTPSPESTSAIERSQGWGGATTKKTRTCDQLGSFIKGSLCKVVLMSR